MVAQWLSSLTVSFVEEGKAREKFTLCFSRVSENSLQKIILTKDREYGKLNAGEFTGTPCAPFFLQEFYDITLIRVKQTHFPV